MPRKRNETTEKAIYTAARDIMLNDGYEAVTYTALARRTGLPRGTVQYYCPKKEALAMRFMKTVALLAVRGAKDELGSEAHPVSVIYAASQIVLGMYYSTPGMRRFMLEISSDRRLQHAVSPDWTDWIREVAGIENLNPTQDQIDRMTMANGGVHEMHFVCLSEGRTPDFAKLTREATLEQALVLGIKKRAVSELLDRGVLTQKRAQEIGVRLLGSLAACDLADEGSAAMTS